jgi:hypothetical protein
VVVVFADEGYRYEDDVYNDDWLQARHLEKTNGIESPQWVSHPLEAREPWAAIGWRRRTLQSVVEARSGVTIS